MRTPAVVGRLLRATERQGVDIHDEPRASVRGGALTIDCRGCHGAQDLKDQGCMRCALQALSQAHSFESLVLSRSQDVAYDGGCIQVLRDLTEAVRLCREAAPRSDERGCAACPCRPSLQLERMADSIPYAWEGVAPRLRPPQQRAQCGRCLERLNDAFCSVQAKLRSIEMSSSREAFMVVGESSDA